jgi:acyl-CoA synthetase (AMP-forming)/AMP-acid ligase II
MAEEIELGDVRHLIFGGEALQWNPLVQWSRIAPLAQVTNMYGITEVTVHATMHRVSAYDNRDKHSTPIGKVLPGFDWMIVDDDLRPIANGDAGELLLRGPQVMSGYLGDSAATDKALIRLPGKEDTWYRTGDLVIADEKAELHYIGRNDQQVQLRGYRIELGEVECAIRSTGIVRDASIVMLKTVRGESQLCAFVLCAQWDAGVKTELKAALAKLLPQYMLPSRYVGLDSFPTTPSGKVDRQALLEAQH